MATIKKSIKNGVEYCINGDFKKNGISYTGIKIINSGNEYCFYKAPKEGTIEFLLVGGGGGGGSGPGGGGGGAGGYIECDNYIINSSCNEVPIVIGRGGGVSSNGGNSCMYGLVAYGGGAGGIETGSLWNCSGGSGGGGGVQQAGCNGIQGQGNKGGNGGKVTGGCGGGGGGGAGSAGCNYGGKVGGNGGAGKCSCISGECKWYSGGGAGSGTSSRGVDGEGSACYGCYGGGGGGYNGSSGHCINGCSGIVIIRYLTDGSCGIKSTSTGGCKYTCGDYTIHCFTSSDTFMPIFK